MQQFEDEPSDVCPYIQRMGVCLEPAACSLKHKTMNINAKEFVPGQSPNADKEFVPGQITQADEVQGYNFESRYVEDEEFGMAGEILNVEARKDCVCCKGDVNNCSGEACANLGICYCMVVDDEDR